MKKKLIISVLSIVFVIMIFFQVKEKQTNDELYDSRVCNSTVITFQKSSQDFYYDQLLDDEKIVFEKILALYKDRNNVEIILDEPCSIYNISRVADAVRETQQDNYWDFIFCYCFDKDDNLLNVRMEQADKHIHEKNIFKILVQFNSNGDNEEKKLQNIKNYGQLKQVLESNLRNDEFQKVNKLIKEEKRKIISLLDKNFSEKQAVEFFQKWIIKNVKYNYDVENQINKIDMVSFPNEYIKNTSSACVLEKKGICSGISDLLVDLCNEVGIEAYSVKGTLSVNSQPSGAHQWVAVVIGGETFYTDPTKDIILQEISPLYSSEQFYGRKSHKYIPLFYFSY